MDRDRAWLVSAQRFASSEHWAEKAALRDMMGSSPQRPASFERRPCLGVQPTSSLDRSAGNRACAPRRRGERLGRKPPTPPARLPRCQPSPQTAVRASANSRRLLVAVPKCPVGTVSTVVWTHAQPLSLHRSTRGHTALPACFEHRAKLVFSSHVFGCLGSHVSVPCIPAQFPGGQLHVRVFNKRT